MQLDIRWVDWNKPQTLMPLVDFCQWRHLLHLEGRSWSSRFKYLMLCRSTIVSTRTPWIEFWSRAMVEGHNLYVVPAVTPENKGLQLIEAGQQLIADEPLAER